MNDNITTLDAFKANTHTIYLNDNTRFVCALNLLFFAEKQFKSSYIINHLQELKSICDKLSKDKLPNKEELIGFIDNGLIDAIKISICFENYIKAVLLCQGYLIHNIDKENKHEYWKKQKNQPIEIEEFKPQYYECKKVLNPKLNKKIEGLKDTTELYSKILNKQKYKDIIGLDEEILEILNEFNKFRNSLHLQNSLSLNLTNSTCRQLELLSKFVLINIKKNRKRLNQEISGKNNTLEPTWVVKKT